MKRKSSTRRTQDTIVGVVAVEVAFPVAINSSMHNKIASMIATVNGIFSSIRLVVKRDIVGVR